MVHKVRWCVKSDEKSYSKSSPFLYLSLGQKAQQPVHIVQRMNACFGELAVLNVTAGQCLDQLNQFNAVPHLIVQITSNETWIFFVYEICERFFLCEIVNLFRLEEDDDWRVVGEWLVRD